MAAWPAKPHELRLIAKVARLHFEQGMSPSLIAVRLDVAPGAIARMLKRAQSLGLIHTTVRMPQGMHVDLEEALRRRYGLTQAIVADCIDPQDAQTSRAVGAAAAYYLEGALRGHEIIGVSPWSATLLTMVDHMHPIRSASSVVVVQIVGGLGGNPLGANAHHLTTQFARLVDGTPLFLPSWPVVGSGLSRDFALQEPEVRAAFDRFDDLTLALNGIGQMDFSVLPPSSANVLAEDELAALRRSGAVGHMSLRFFDAQGRKVTHRAEDRVIGIELDQIRAARRSVAVASGREKAAAIRGALAGGWIHILVTDQWTAEAILQPDDT